MRFRRSAFGAREMTLLASVFTLAVAALILWLGHRHDLVIDRLVREGSLAQGDYVSTRYGSRSEGSSDEVTVRYTVDGVDYQTYFLRPSSERTEALFQPELIRTPRLGEERLWQVVYLPSDPEVARLRDDLKKSDIATYGTAGMFLLIGTVFGFMGLCVLRKRKPKRR